MQAFVDGEAAVGPERSAVVRAAIDGNYGAARRRVVDATQFLGTHHGREQQEAHLIARVGILWAAYHLLQELVQSPLFQAPRARF